MLRNPPSPAPWRALPSPTRLPLALCLTLALLGPLACAPRILDEPVAQSEGMSVFLRKEIEDGEVVPKQYKHPATISDVRLSHILANLFYEDADGKKIPTFRPRAIYDLAEALNKAISQAGPDQEIVAQLVAVDRRNLIFSAPKATAFRAHFDESDLIVEFFDIERDVEREQGKPGQNDSYSVPQKMPEQAPPFRLVGGEGQYVEGPRRVRIDWRNPYFAKPVSFGRSGQRRRTILLESDEDPSGAPAPTPAPGAEITPEMRDEQIRALDQLDGLRRAGLIKEAEFQRRRRLVLEGRLEEAGYGATDP